MTQFFNKSLILFTVSLALTACNTTTSITTNTHTEPTVIIDSYYGIINSSGIDNKSVTTFHLNDNNEIVGDYHFYEDTQKVSGTLSNCIRTDKIKLHCLWTDKYGTGNLSMIFNQSFDEFVGAWSLPGNTPSSAWTGKKQ